MNNKNIFLGVFLFLISLASHAQTLKEAIRLTENEQYEAAASVFRNLIIREPSNGTNYYYFGENYLFSDDPDSATMMFNKGNEVDPNNVLNKIGLAEVKLNQVSMTENKSLAQANVNEANTLIDNAVAKAGPKNAQVLLEAAGAYINFKNKNLDKAKQLLDKAVALEPKNPEIQILYGDIYSELNNGTLAAEYYNKAIELDKNSVKAIVSKGRLYKRSTNFQGAAEEFENAIKIDPSFAPAHRELGEVYWKLGKLDKAKAEYKTYLDLSKNNKSARIRYASFLYATKEYAAALNEINQLSKIDENNLTLLRVASYCYFETKDTVKALAAVKKLFSKLSEEKITATDFEYYGKILALNNQDSLAVINLRKAFEKDNNRCDLLTEIYKSYDKMKKWVEAASVLQEKIQKCKGITSTDYFNLGKAYFFNGEFTRADSAFSKVVELLPKWPSGFLWKADNYANIDSTSQAYANNYEKFIEVATQDTTNIAKYKNKIINAYKILASYYFKKVPDETIIGYLKKILELDPEDEYAIKNLKGYEQQKKKQ